MRGVGSAESSQLSFIGSNLVVFIRINKFLDKIKNWINLMILQIWDKIVPAIPRG